MADREGSHRNASHEKSVEDGYINRRRLLQLTGAGIVGGAIATGGVFAAETTLPHMIVFDGTDTSSTAQYEFGVTGSVEAHGEFGALEDSDSLDGTHVTGAVHQDKDAYRFSGNLSHLDVTGEVVVRINYGGIQTATDKLEIVAPANTSIDYTFTSSEKVEKDLNNGGNSAEDTEDTIWANDGGPWTVTGTTGNGNGDSYDLHGDVTSFGPIEGDFTVFVNGEVVTARELINQGYQGGQSDDSDAGPDEPHTLKIVAPELVEYSFTTTDRIEKVIKDGSYGAEEANDSVTENDDGTWTASGLTGNGYDDMFTFVGEVVDFNVMAGEAVLYLDGDEISVSELVS